MPPTPRAVRCNPRSLQHSIGAHGEGRPIWVTETGLATWDLAQGCEARFSEQVERLTEAARAPAQRIYWYSLMDLDPQRDAIEGFHVDENEYHLGLATFDGRYKPAFERMKYFMQHH
jgi:CDP-paratose 2-epimerase